MAGQSEAEPIRRIDRRGARRLIEAAGGHAEVGGEPRAAADAWSIKTAHTSAIAAYAMLVVIAMLVSARGPEHASAAGGLLGSTPDVGANDQENHMNKRMISVGVAVLAVASSAGAADAVQWRVEDGGNGHWYQFVISTSPQTWQRSRDAAVLRGGHLTTLASQAEDLFVRSVLPPFTDESGGQAWLGAYQDRTAPGYSEPFGGWRWVTGEPMDYQAWSHPGSEWSYPGSDFLTLAHFEFQPGFWWNDLQSDYFGGRFFSIVEWDADCNQDNIVDYGQILDGSLVDTNANGIPDCCEQGTPCSTCHLYDLNLNGSVDGADLGVMLAFWGPVSPAFPRADINGDGRVDGADLGLLLANWGACP